ncbi:MAG: 2-oxoisovalerate dehydrogenase [Chthoniobacterales bacterium]
MNEITFEIREDEEQQGYTAAALGYDIFTEGETMEELRRMVREAVKCHFFDFPTMERPKAIRLHLVCDEVLVA